MLIDSITVLAQTTLPDPQSSAATGWLFVAIGGLALTCNQVLGAFANFKKLRGSGDDARITALEHSLRETELRLERRIGEQLGSINTRLGNLEGTLTNLVADFSRSLGELEGRTNALKRNS